MLATKITIDVRNAENTESIALSEGTRVFYSTGDIDESDDFITIVNKTAGGTTLGAVKYDKEKEVRAEYKEGLTLTIKRGDVETKKNFSSLTKLFAEITNSKTDYTIDIFMDLEETKLALPKSAQSITVNGHEHKLTLIGTTTLKAKYDLAFNNITIDAKNAKGAQSKLTISAQGKGGFNAENLTVVSTAFSVKGKKNTANLVNCGDFAVVQGFTTVNLTGTLGITKTFKATNLNLLRDADETTGNVTVADLRIGNGAAVTVDNLLVLNEARIGFAPGAKKVKAITVKKGITADSNSIHLYSVSGGVVAPRTVIIIDKTGNVAGSVFVNDGVSSGNLSNNKGKIST